VGASLSTAERRILEAADDARADGVLAERLTDVVRRALAHMPGGEFRDGVARLAERRLLQARVRMKTRDEVGQVVIEQITPLGRGAIGRGGSPRRNGRELDPRELLTMGAEGDNGRRDVPRDE
jgi:hypothetical protein